MFNDKLSNCPVCGQRMERGFSHRNVGLSLITPEKMRKFAFRDEDLNKAGLKQLLPAKAEYNLSYHCPNCRIYIVDYSKAVSTEHAKALAESM